MRKTIWIEPLLVSKIEDVRSRERPIPSFGAICNRLMWLGLSGYQAPKIDYEKVIELETPKSKYCDGCGSQIEDPASRFCFRCGREISIPL